MKKIFVISILILYSFIANAQYGITQNLGGPTTLVQNPNYGGFRGGLIPFTFTDTTAASLTNLKYYAGALIYTSSPRAVFWRDLVAQQWVQVLPSGGSTGTLAWVMGGNNPVVSDGSGNAILGPQTNNGIAFMSNNTQRVILPATGLTFNQVVGDTTLNKPMTYNISTKNWGYSYWYGGGSGAGWSLTGNAGTTAGTNFFGTTDNQDGVFKANSSEQFRMLSSGGIRIPTTVDSTIGVIFKGSDRFIHNYQNPATATNLGHSWYIGRKSGNFNFTGASGGFGGRNLAIGDSTLYANTTGYRNVAIGVWNATNNTTGFENTTVGANAFQYNTTGRQNTALGAISLENNTTGLRNTAVGFSSMQYGTTAERNVAIGGRAMQNTSSSFANVAVGFDALAYNSTADHNTAVGLDALYYSNGSHNTAVGDSTLWGRFGVQLHVGYKNTAIGSRAGYHLGDTYPNYASIYDTAVTFLGANSSRDSSIAYTTSLQNSTAIGYNSRIYASNQMSFGDENITTNLFRGKIGINTRTPDSALHIVGGLKYANGSQGAGKVLTSDANGGATWARWTARVGSTTSSATPTINTDNVDIYKLTAQTADITSFTTNLSGTPVDGDILEIQITGTAARAITWGSSFVSTTVTLPATTVTTATLTVVFQYYTTSSYGNNKWHIVNYY